MSKKSSTIQDKSIAKLFEDLGQGKKEIPLHKILLAIAKEGILRDDNRLQPVLDYYEVSELKPAPSIMLSPSEFEDLVSHNQFIKKALLKDQIIPEFEDFCKDIMEIYRAVEKNKSGEVADYIPQLARVNPEQFGVSICTIDGQRFSYGDIDVPFCLQSSSKPINYSLALEEHGRDKVHQHVGREPSGISFNALSLNTKGLPHNPMINAGAIMSCSLVQKGKEQADRFDYILNTWKKLCAGKYVGFDNPVYLSEKETADRNFALGYFMRENGAFPEDTDIIETLELYFQCCSIETTAHNLAPAPATLANAGINPLTGEQIFQPATVRDCMSLMLSCGMYDWSGEFAFKIGLPAKSGVSGVVQLVIPNVMGIVIWSPRLDHIGNSARGVEFCERLVKKFNFHNYDSIARNKDKKDPRQRKNESKIEKLVAMIYAASGGDLAEIKRLQTEGLDLDLADYDGRTAMHLAASEGHLAIVKYLHEQGAFLEPKDRWGGTPLEDAKRHGHKDVYDYLAKQTTTPKNGQKKKATTAK
jgi:glutaminase